DLLDDLVSLLISGFHLLEPLPHLTECLLSWFPKLRLQSLGEFCELCLIGLKGCLHYLLFGLLKGLNESFLLLLRSLVFRVNPQPEVVRQASPGEYIISELDNGFDSHGSANGRGLE